MSKRVMSLMLAALMIFTSLPMQAYAAAVDAVAETISDASTEETSVFLENASLSFGDILGAAENEPEEATEETTEATEETTEATEETTEATEETTEATEETTEATEETTEATEETTEPTEESTEPEEYTSDVAPEGYELSFYVPDEELDIEAEEVRFPNRRVLLIEDNLPWRSDANHRVLRSLASYDTVKPSEIGGVDVSKYAVIILANDQSTSSYTAYARFADKIEEFAERGGVIVFGACDGGWSAGYMSDIIPGGVKKHNRYTNYNTIVDSQHPIVTGVLTDNKVLTNSLLYSNYCSHVYFDDSTFPEGTRVILREQNGYPTLIEYPLGNGRIIASGLTWEHNMEYTKTFSPVAMDDLYTYALYVSGIGNDDMENLGGNKLKDTDHLVMAADAKSHEPIAGAEVLLGKQKGVTDENGKALFQNITAGVTNVTVKKSGYRTRIVSSRVTGGDMEYVFLEADDGQPYITGAQALVTIVKKDGTKQIKTYDLFTETVEINKDAEYTITLTGDWHGKKAGSYMLYLGSQCAYSSTGKFTIKDGKCSNSKGEAVAFGDGKLHARMRTADGKQSGAVELELYSPKTSSGSIWEDTDLLFSIGGEDGIKISIPKDMPVVGGMEFQVKLDEIPICIEAKEDSVKIAIGINKFKEKDPEKAMADWKKQWESVDRTANLKEVLKKFGGKAGGFTLKKGWDDTDLNVIGYAEGKFDKDTHEITQLSGGFIISAELMYKYNQQFVVGPVPVYFEIGGGVKAEDEGQVQGILVDAKQLILDNTLTITPKFTIGGGVGINGALSVGAEGAASLPIVLCDSKWNVTDNSLDVFTNVSLKGEMNLTASLLFVFNAKHSIAQGEWQIMRYYWDTGEIEFFEAEDLAAMSVTDFSDTSSFYLMDRSYLNETSDWYTEDMSVASFQNGMTILQTGVMPTTDPQVVCMDDGTAIMVFQTDDPGRSAVNRSSLVYSVYQNGVWSAPAAVWDNGCADMSASLATGKAGTYVVWQKLNTVLSDSASVEEVASHAEIASAVFDPDTNTFVNAAYLTNDDVLQMMPSVAVGSGSAVAHYVTNTSNQLLGGGTNEIVRVNLSSGASSVLYSGSAYVASLTTSVGTKSVDAAYILDLDGDRETADDTCLYVNGKQVSGTNGAKLNAQYANGTLYWFDNAEGTVCTYSGGTVRQLVEPDASVGTNFRIMRSAGGKLAIVWLGTTTEGQNCIYAKIKNASGWSAPVELVTADESLMKLAGYLDAQGNWELIALSKEGENSANLLYSGVTPYLTTKAKNISYIPRNREDLYPQILADFTNNSENTLDHLNVDFRDASGNLVHSQVVECSILGGENKKLVLDVDLPVQTQVTEYTVTIYPEGEDDLSDNQGKITVGYGDLALLLETQKQGGNTLVNVKIYNDSDLRSNATLTVREGDPENGIIVDMRKLGELNPGETCNYCYAYDVSKMDFRGQDSKVYYYEVTGSVAESILSNNSASMIFQNPFGGSQQTPTGIFTSAPEPVELNLDSVRSYQIEASTEPAASGKWTLLYSSSNPEIAAVDENGQIRAVREGSATITIQAENTQITKDIHVVVGAPSAKTLTLKLTEVTPATTGYQVNDEYAVEVYGNSAIPMDKSLFTFSSSKANVLKVDEQTGNILLLSPGTAVLSAVYRDNTKLKVSLSVKVVNEQPGSISTSYQWDGPGSLGTPCEITTQTLKEYPLRMVPITCNERGTQMQNVTYTFASNNTAVAKVDANGLITGTGREGIAVISAKPKGSSLSTELTMYVFDSGKPLLTADSTISLNTYMTSGHPDAPVIQLQSVRGNYISNVDYYLYQKGKGDSYTATQINVRSLGNDGNGLYTFALGCDNALHNPLKSGDYYLRTVANGEEYYINLKLKLSQKLPDVKIQPDSYNVFFSDQIGTVRIDSRETVTSVEMKEAPAAKGKLTGGFNLERRWDSETGSYYYCVVPSAQLIGKLQTDGLKQFNLKYTFTATVQDYNTAVSRTLNMPAAYTLPSIRLSSSTVYASANNTVTARLQVSAMLNKRLLNFSGTPTYSTEFKNYAVSVSEASQDGALSLYCSSLEKGSVKGTLYVRDRSNWRHSVPVALTVTSQNLTKNCKINPVQVNAITKQTVSQSVLLSGKQAVPLQSRSLVNDELFRISSDSNGIHITPVANSSQYKGSYTYKLSLYTTSAETMELPITIRVSKTAPGIAASSGLFLDGTQRGRTIRATLSGKLDVNMLDESKTSFVVKKGNKVSTDISAAYVGGGELAITTRQKCSGKYTVQMTPVLTNGETLKIVSFPVTCTTNASVSAKVQKALDMRAHLTDSTAVTLTIKNNSAKVTSISIVNGFSSIFESRDVDLTGKAPVINVGLKDGMDIAGGTYSLPLSVNLEDGSTLNTSVSVKVICSKLTLSVPNMQMALSAKRYKVTKAFAPALTDNAQITDITNADNKSPFKVSYSDGSITVTADQRTPIKKGVYTINCVVYASNDLSNTPGTACKLKVTVR